MAVIKGDGNNNHLYGTPCDDQIDGGGGDDVIFGGCGDDELRGGAGNDRIYGGSGDDTLIADGGDDRLFGGGGDDLFRITHAGNIRVVGGEDYCGRDLDILDLSAGLGHDYADVNVIWTGPECGRAEFLDSDGRVIGRLEFSEIEKVVVCFTPGTTIMTQTGERPVEELTVGDRVHTRDNGMQEIRWIGTKNIGHADLVADARLAPVLIRRGALGDGLPERDMMVSPNHRLLMTSSRAQLYFEEREVLAAAKHLVGLPGFSRVAVPQTSYIHFMCDHHEVVQSNGIWTESFQPGDYTLNAIDVDQRQELNKLFPDLRSAIGRGAYLSARRALRRHEAELLIAS